MKNSIQLLFLIFFVSFMQHATAQRIVPIPFYKEGDNKKLLIENDDCYRVFQSLLKENSNEIQNSRRRKRSKRLQV